MALTRFGVRRMLAFFVLHRNRWVSRSSICESVWPAESENANRFSITLSRLRSDLNAAEVESSIHSGPGGYRFEISDDLIDIAVFEQRIRRCGSVVECREVLALWGAEPYLDLDPGECFSEVARLKMARNSGIKRLADSLLESKHPSDALEALTLVGDDDGPDEKIAGLRMLALYQLGRSQDALEICQQLRHQLRDEFGLDLSPATRALELAILRHDFASKSGDQLSTLVGRHAECQTFERILTDPTIQRSQIIVIRGEPGVGKTRLANACCEIALGFGQKTTSVRCHENESSGRYRTIRLLLDSREDDVDQTSQATWATGGGALFESAFGLHETGDRLQVFDSLSDHVNKRVGDQAQTWLIDDAQWADESSLALLAHLLRHSNSAGLVVILTVRNDQIEADDLLSTWLVDIARDATINVIELNGLTRNDFTKLVLLADHSVDEQTVSDLHINTRGSPFLALEMARADPLSRGLPPSIEAAFASRLSRHGVEGAEVLDWLATCNQGCELSLLVELVGIESDRLAHLLEYGERAGLLRTNVESGKVVVHVAHDLLRRFLTTRQGVLRNSVRNTRLSQILLARGDVVNAAAHSWRSGPTGNHKVTVDLCRRAAQVALRTTAYEDAVTHLDRALEAGSWSETLVGRPDDSQTWLLMAQARHRLGDAEGRMDAARLACDCSRAAGDWTTFALAALEHGGIRSTYGIASAETMALLDEALMATPPDNQALRARLASRAGQEAYHVQRFADAERLTVEAELIARGLGDHALLAITLEGRIWALHQPQSLTERLAVCEEMVDLSVRTQQPEWELLGRIWRVCAWLEGGKIDDAENELPLMSSLSQRLRIPSHEFRVAALRATLATIGCRSDAFDLAQRTRDVGLQIEARNAEQSFAAQLLPLLRDQGALSGVLPMIEQMATEYVGVAGWRCALCFVLAECGELERASTELDALSVDRFAIVPRDLAWLMAMSFLVESTYATQSVEHARTLTALLSPHEKQHVGLFDLGWNGCVSYYLGLLHMVVGNLEQARSFLSVAIVEHRRVNAPALLLRAELAFEKLISKESEQPANNY